MYRKNVKGVRIFRVRFNDYNRSIHTQYRGIDTETGRNVGWSETEVILSEEIWFLRKLAGK